MMMMMMMMVIIIIIMVIIRGVGTAVCPNPKIFEFQLFKSLFIFKIFLKKFRPYFRLI